MSVTMTKRRRQNEKIAPREPLEPVEAFKTLKRFESPKFDQTVEVCVHLSVDPRQADQLVRGSVSLPRGIGQSKRVIAFCAPEHVEAANAAGAIEAGGEDLATKIENGWYEFDVAVASPDMMRVVSKLGRVLGPKGLMPSPKAGTVTPNVAEAVTEYAAGKVEYRTDKGGNVHAIVGKMSFPEQDLAENLEHFIDTLAKARPSAVKGNYIKKIVVSGTMTPGVPIKHAQTTAVSG